MTTPLHIVFAVTETGPQAAAGDLFTAMELGQALQARLGWTVAYHPRGEPWYTLPGADVVVAMLEDFDPRQIRAAKPGLIRVAWARNWFERWAGQPWMAHFDLLLASSQQAVRYLSEATGRRAQLMRLATNSSRFNGEGRAAAPTLDFVFTGSHWGSPRDVVAALSALPRRFKGAIHGKHWEQQPQLAHWNRGFVPYERLPEVYAQAHIVIDDGNHVTKNWGAANSRVFDALAAGCLVITNAQSVSDACFDGLLPVYRDAAHLEVLLDRYLNDLAAMKALAATLQVQVLKHHSYTHRARELQLQLHLLPQLHGRQPKRPPFISIVVPLFNHLQETQAMLESLLATLQDRDDWELVLIDDGSTDGTREWLDTLHLPRVLVIKNVSNQGFARSNNIAVAQCRGDVLVLANNDLVFSPGWLQPMLDVLQDASRQAGLVGNVQTRVVDGGLDHTGVDVNFRGQLDHIRVPPVSQGLNGAAERFAVTAACIAIRRELFVSVGGFDEAYVNGCEDMDLCFKLTAAGWRNWVALGSVMQHHVSLSRGTASASHERNSEVLHARWGAHLQQRLAHKYLAWLQRGEAHEPLDGRDDMLKPMAGRSYSLADAEGLARCVLQRNGWHRDRLLGRTPPEPPYSEVRCDGGLVASVLHGYAHPAGEVVFHLPAGVGLHGVFVLGQVAGLPPGGAPWHVTLEINGLQRLRFALNGLDFNVGTHRPLVWSDQPSQLRVVIETPSDGAGRVYLSRLVVDDGVQLMVDRWTEQLAFADTTRLTAPQWAALSPEAFVQHAYRALLGRAADPNGFESYAARLRMGLSRADLWTELSASDEAAQQSRQQAGVASG